MWWWVHYLGIARELVDGAAIKRSKDIFIILVVVGQDSWPKFSCIPRDAIASWRHGELNKPPEIPCHLKYKEIAPTDHRCHSEHIIFIIKFQSLLVMFIWLFLSIPLRTQRHRCECASFPKIILKFWNSRLKSYIQSRSQGTWIHFRALSGKSLHVTSASLPHL